MNNKFKKWFVWILWIGGLAAASLAFALPARLRYLFLSGYQDEIYRTKGLVFDSGSVAEGVTLAAFVIALVALFQSIAQTKATRKQIELLTETTRLNDMDAILGAFSAHYAQYGAYASEFYLLAHTIAVGATGVSGQFETFRKNLKALMGKL